MPKFPDPEKGQERQMHQYTLHTWCVADTLGPCDSQVEITLTKQSKPIVTERSLCSDSTLNS